MPVFATEQVLNQKKAKDPQILSEYLLNNAVAHFEDLMALHLFQFQKFSKYMTKCKNKYKKILIITSEQIHCPNYTFIPQKFSRKCLLKT